MYLRRVPSLGDTGPVFVGRAGELGELDRALDTARTGRGATVLIAGDAGIGKTTMVAEVATRARDVGMTVLLGRSMDLVGADLPYQPFAEALRTVGKPWEAPGSQLRVFEETLAILTASAPLLLTLEDLHWADTSTLDLVVYLAHNIDDRPILLLATFRADEPSSGQRMRRLADGVRHSGSALLLELGPLGHDEVTAMLRGRADGSLVDAIVTRSEGNPFFAEELLATGHRGDDLPHHVRDLLLQGLAGLDDRTLGLLRLAAAAGRDVAYPLLYAAAELPERDVRDSLREAVERGVLVADQATGTFRFRHALLAEAVYATILPGEREELHARLADQLARNGTASAAELAPHWAAAGRSREALATSIEAARQAEAVFGLAEALAHLERALVLWPAVPDASELAGIDLATLCSRAAELASQVGASPRAVELGQRAIDLVGATDAYRAAILYVRLGEYLHETGRDDAGLAALERAAEIVPAEPPSPERAYTLGLLAGGLMVAWRYAESLPVAEHALALARGLDAREAEVRALIVVGADSAYLGRGEEGLGHLRQALDLAEQIDDHIGLERAYINLTDAVMMLGRPRESAELAQAGIEVLRRYGIDSAVLVSNRIEALLAIGEWASADSVSAAALRTTTGSYPYMLLMLRADLEMGRGDFEAARMHLDAALATLRPDRGLGIYDVLLAELAMLERRWTDADRAVQDGLSWARDAAQLRVWFCAKGLRAQAELVALARARRDTDAVHAWLDRAESLITVARRAAEDASAVTPNAGGWLALAEAEYERARGDVRPSSWSQAASTWDRLGRRPLAAYCRWREAEALVADGASRTEASGPLRDAHGVATQLGARPLLREIEMLAQRARLDLTPPATPSVSIAPFGLTRREDEVLSLVARGYTDREIAATLVISVKTASVHVSHILRKLGAPNRQEAAAIAHRLAPPV
jgi:DNA-binding CsgD family transcriptional regulator/tetratricopeptide (TPR) repeat protein